MGQILIKFQGSMSPDANGGEVTVEVPHSGTFDECFDAAHEALDKGQTDLKAKLGDEYK